MPSRIPYRRTSRQVSQSSLARASNPSPQLYHHLVLRLRRTPISPIFNYLHPFARKLFHVGLNFLQEHVFPRVWAAITAFIQPPLPRVQPRDPILVLVTFDQYLNLLASNRPSFTTSDFDIITRDPSNVSPRPISPDSSTSLPPYYPPAPTNTTPSAGTDIYYQAAGS